MQFVSNGPDIPDELLQAHEEGRVVFFCGAGISYPAGLPTFKGLVDKTYIRLGTVRSPIEEESFKKNQFDATLNLLENRLPGQRQGLEMRKAVADVLVPNFSLGGATDTHIALLDLATSRGGALRLVTTNFDRVFAKAAESAKRNLPSFAAPMLPIPKASRWDGLVYLHGALPEDCAKDPSALHRLILTSGDFGLAYLTERWAARFVSDLFKNYVICFVGYSIDDPVLRYMMDALAADRMLGEHSPQAWALGSCEMGNEHAKTLEWRAKGVTPILYEVPQGGGNHALLHHTLKAWAKTYRDGVFGKEQIVVTYALANPTASTQQDNFVGRMLWAISDKTGLPAKRFAEYNPAPPLTWLLNVFAEHKYGHRDLSRFDVASNQIEDSKLSFSLLERPAPYRLAPSMAMVARALDVGRWDEVMFHLARWLIRHLNDPKLVIWFAEHGGRLHPEMWRLVDDALDYIEKLEHQNKLEDLNNIRAQAPNGVPSSFMRKLWGFLLNGRAKSPWQAGDLYRWTERVARLGLTSALQLQIRDLLAPKIDLREPFKWDGELEEDDEDPDRVRQLVDWELVLASNHVHAALHEVAGGGWRSALPALLDDLQQLLLDAQIIMSTLGSVEKTNEVSRWGMPSISPHWQNRGYRDWTALVELVRDAWLGLFKSTPKQAVLKAENWFESPYVIFKRLALFAAAQENSVSTEVWSTWLSVDHAEWLWSDLTRREVSRLLVLQGGALSGVVQRQLEEAIIAGPPRELHHADLEEERWRHTVDYEVWLRLAKLQASNVQLGPQANTRLADLAAAYPDWRLKFNEKEEFSVWMSGSGDPDEEDYRTVDVVPRKRHELAKWLRQAEPERRPFHEDTWRDACRTRLFHSLLALCDLSAEGLWPINRWAEALQAWSEDGVVARAWRNAAPLIVKMPDGVLSDLDHAMSWWLEKVSNSVVRHEDIFLELCQRVLALPLQAKMGIRKNDKPVDEPVFEAINHPIGHVTQALINLWLKRKPSDGDGLPSDLKPIFTMLCDLNIEEFRHGRILLSTRAIALYRVDREWVAHYLLPLFDWSKNKIRAKQAWEGFLWSPRRYPPLMVAFKKSFLETAQHYELLGEHKRQFAAFLTYVALQPSDGYETNDFRTAFQALPRQALREAAEALVQAQEGSADQKAQHWRERTGPFWRDVWPKAQELASPDLSELLGRLCIAAGDAFPEAVESTINWLQPIEFPYYVLHLLLPLGLCSKFPGHALRLLDKIIGDHSMLPPELTACLREIAAADAALVDDAALKRLSELVRRQGFE